MLALTNVRSLAEEEGSDGCDPDVRDWRFRLLSRNVSHSTMHDIEFQLEDILSIFGDKRFT
jgi:hypothetical protein